MSKSETMTTETGKAGEPAALTDMELDAVTGGVGTDFPRMFESCAKNDVPASSGHERWIAVESYSWTVGP
jgi:hypothetical protein